MTERRLLLAALGLVACTTLSLITRTTLGYSVGTSLTSPCHERLTTRALVQLLSALDASGIALPDSGVWRKVGKSYVDSLALSDYFEDLNLSELTDEQMFVAFSVVTGVRNADTDGHSTSDLNALRRLNNNTDPEAQYQHALRAIKDDGVEGDIQAISGTKNVIMDAFLELGELQDDGDLKLLQKAPLYLDFYGSIEVDVVASAYLFGRAAHALQDAYSHMLRSKDGHTVLHVLNYIDAIGDNYDRGRDGLAHSNTLDRCNDETATLTQAAADATIGMAHAMDAYLAGDAEPLAKGLAPCVGEDSEPGSCGWITYYPPCQAAWETGDSEEIDASCCTQSNEFCHSFWLPVAEKDQTGPILGEIFRCSTMAPSRASPTSSSLCLLACLAGLGIVRQKRWLTAMVLLGSPWLSSRAEASPPDLTPPSFATSSAKPHHEETPKPAAESPPEGRTFAGFDLHWSLLSDTPDHSMLSISAGFALRAGYRLRHWGVLIAVERDYWRATELVHGMQQGVLNVGLGGEYLFQAGALRSSLLVGPSVLLFDTVLHDKGEVGVYTEARPLGVRFRLSKHFAVWFDPLTAAFMQPMLREGPVVRVLQYRTVLGLEFSS